MTMNHPTYVPPMQWFYPIGNTAAASLSQDIPPGKPVNALLLGNGDPRNILFTLSNDQDHKLSRTYDFTFCDVEPAIMARNLLLFTLLLDNTDPKTEPDYWSVFYDLHINTATLNTIRKHAHNLVQLSEDMVSWTASPYDDILQIVNTETLSVLHEYWLKYANYTDTDRSKFFRFRKQCQDVYEHTPPGFTKQGLQMLSRSFGPRLTNAVSITEYYTNQFWNTGIVRASSDPVSMRDRQCNPLAIYSSTANDRFAFHYRSNPLCGFHLAAPLTLLNPDNTHFFKPQEDLKDNVPLVAKMQFRGWCRAFQTIAQTGKAKGGKLKIRFFIGDALQFCTGLNHLRLGKDMTELSIYSRPWSTQPLCFDGPGYELNSKDKAPLSFNVIDTSSLADDVGFINLLAATVPLLEDSAASTLYTESMKSSPPKEEQPNLLTELFNADIGSMCTIFGLLPAPYITGITSRAKDPAYLDDHTPVFNRMNWKIATSIDPNVNSIVSRLLCRPSPKDLAKLLLDVYVGMFAHETGAYLAKIARTSSNHSGRMRFPQPHYTRKSFAVFLEFLRSRVTVDWTEFWTHFLHLVENDKELVVGKQSIMDLKMYCNLYGFNTLQELDSSENIYCWNRGILSSKNVPKITTLIISIPRRKLRNIYNACVETGHRINIIFQIHLFHKSSGPTVKTSKPFHPAGGKEVNSFSSFQPVFGKYSSSDNTIERDPTGWFGQSDLHLCAYVPTALLIQKDPSQCEVAIRLQPEMSCVLLLQEQLGYDLEIFKARLLSGEYIHVAANLPGLKGPDMTIRPVDEVKPLLVSNEKVDVTYPLLVPGKGHFVTQIILKKEEEREILNSKQAVSNHQISPCRITIECGNYKYTCAFPFPVSKPVLEIDKGAATIKVIAPLLTPQNNRTSLQHFYPLLRDKRYGLCTWNLPYINFSQLAQMSFVEYPNAWLLPHLAGIYSDQELRTPKSDTSDHLLGFKDSLYAVMEFITTSDIYKPCLFTIQPLSDKKDQSLIFIATGLYFDGTSGSVVAEANVFQVTDRVFYDPRFLPILAHIASNDTNIQVEDQVYRLWRRALPAMAEICRDYPHLSACEYKAGTSSDLGDLESPLCECGVGKVGGDVTEIWEYAAEFVTRVAISPMFAAPYLESAKGGVLARPPRKGSQQKVEKQAGLAATTGTRETREMTTVPPNVKCRECGKDGEKKCGGCGNVYYCSRACQRRDWKAHKAACTKALTQ